MIHTVCAGVKTKVSKCMIHLIVSVFKFVGKSTSINTSIKRRKESTGKAFIIALFVRFVHVQRPHYFDVATNYSPTQL